MDYRQGVCTGCQNSFRVPATFVQNKAKCPKCGGVVEIGPVQSGGASAAPAAAAAATPTAAAATTSSAPAAAPKPAAAPAPVPARTPAPAKPAASAPASAVPAKPVAKPAAAAPVAKPAAVPAKPAATPAAPKTAPAAAKPAAAGPSVRATAEAAAAKVRSGAGAKPKGRSKDDDEDEGSGSKRRRGSAAPKKKSVAPMVISAVIFVALVGFAGWYFGVKMPADEAQAAQAAKAAEDAKRAALLGTGSSVAAAEKPVEGESAPDAAAEPTTPASEPEKAASKPEETKPAETKPAKEKAPVVDDVNLLDLPELGKYSKSSDEEWAEIVALAETFATSGGAPSTRALRKLEELGRPAMPALLNVMRKLNLSDPDDFSRGDLIQRALEKICGGKNWGWKYDKDLETVVYNKKAVRSWFKTWDTAGEDDEQWAGLTKKAAPKEDAEKKPEAGGLDDF